MPQKKNKNIFRSLPGFPYSQLYKVKTKNRKTKPILRIRRSFGFQHWRLILPKLILRVSVYKEDGTLALSTFPRQSCRQ